MFLDIFWNMPNLISYRILPLKVVMGQNGEMRGLIDLPTETIIYSVILYIKNTKYLKLWKLSKGKQYMENCLFKKIYEPSVRVLRVCNIWAVSQLVPNCFPTWFSPQCDGSFILGGYIHEDEVPTYPNTQYRSIFVSWEE